MAEIPIQPKGERRQQDAEVPIQPKRRRSMWPWALGLLAVLLISLLFMRRDSDDTAALPDTSAFVDTTSRLGGRTSGTAAGAVAADTTGAIPAPRAGRADTLTRGDTAARRDSVAARRDTTSR